MRSASSALDVASSSIDFNGRSQRRRSSNTGTHQHTNSSNFSGLGVNYSAGSRSLWTMSNRATTTTAGGPLTTASPSSLFDGKSPHVNGRRQHPLVANQQRRTFIGPLGRVFAQVAATAAVVFGKAFMQAFAQAQQQAKNPKAAAENIGLQKKTMDLSQAYEVLNLSSGATAAEVEAQFEKCVLRALACCVQVFFVQFAPRAWLLGCVVPSK